MIWLKSGSSQAMTIAFGVSQFGRVGVVFVLRCFVFVFANGLFPLGFSVGFQRLAFVVVVVVVGSAARVV